MDKKKILVVDDEVNIQRMLKTILEINDYEVVTASDGEEAIEKVKSEVPDLVLLDLVMPRVNGYQVLEHLKSSRGTSSVPVILFTAAPPEVAAQSGSNALDAVDYVLKPFDQLTLSFLLERIKSLTAE
ncbi:MAG: response regulator [Chlamydiota bacterium]|nr:response regulator [Chlamydiota bacterium]